MKRFYCHFYFIYLFFLDAFDPLTLE